MPCGAVTRATTRCVMAIKYPTTSFPTLAAPREAAQGRARTRAGGGVRGVRHVQRRRARLPGRHLHPRARRLLARAADPDRLHAVPVLPDRLSRLKRLSRLMGRLIRRLRRLTRLA